MPDRRADKVEERHENNEQRARCIRLLRRELGDRFLGGFDHNRYTRARYRDELVQDPTLTGKQAYLALVRAHPICVATTGLHGSIGWKFAEYVALARAIVAEPLRYEVPGALAAGRNYLSFQTADECVARAVELIENAALRHELMRNNATYYDAHQRPDAMVLNALVKAVSRTGIVVSKDLALAQRVVQLLDGRLDAPHAT